MGVAWRNISPVLSFLGILFSLTIPSFTVSFFGHHDDEWEEWCQFIDHLDDEPVMTKSLLYTNELLQCTDPRHIQHRTKRDILRNLDNSSAGIKQCSFTAAFCLTSHQYTQDAKRVTNSPYQKEGGTNRRRFSREKQLALNTPFHTIHISKGHISN